MIVDYLTFTFTEEHEDKLPGLLKVIDSGAVRLETKTGYANDWSLWGTGRLKWGHQGEMLARLSLPGSALALYRESGGKVGELITTIPILHDTKFRGWSSEEVFDYLLEHPEEMPAQGQQFDKHIEIERLER